MNDLPEAYIEYLIHFHGTRDYFECHEILEDHWKEDPHRSAVWVGLIQLAVAQYHHRRKNFFGAQKLFKKAIDKLQYEAEPLQRLGIDRKKLLSLLHVLEEKAAMQADYVSVCLPFSEKKVETLCKSLCRQRNLFYGEPSNLHNEAIVHKHMRRTP
ncbi:DUF309 domain-containing protein [Bacillaceae bacterium SIJ1]|uniref:DUF309 domain-containing protein n=1 Tax=Litoribacterium kuwaitense TaxID=1398745 RepID=UPI0013E9F4DD|nr:DUF309 domain-containing protein [Litoribacterium kuwaitense]NGP43660.1 DUF309 domain-containing protein [Litoribacterium kuwaitense]